MQSLIKEMKLRFKTPEDAISALGIDPSLIRVGRSGSDVVVADSNPFTEVKRMKMTKLGKALFAALSAASPVLAADAALPGLLAKASRKTVKVADLKAAVLAADEGLDPQMVDNLLDAVIGVEDEPKAIETPAAVGDESPADKIRNLLAGKVEDDVLNAVLSCLPAVGDESAANMMKDEDVMKKADVEAAMDAMKASLMAAQKAAVEVRPVVGDVIGVDSAEEIYGMALDHMKLDRQGVEGAAALRALYMVAQKAQSASVASSPVIAADAAAKVTELFPGVARFSRA